MSQKSLDVVYPELEISGKIKITRRSDGENLGTIEIDTESTPPSYRAMRYVRSDKAFVERRETTDFHAAIRWLAENPTLPDPTVDPDIVRLPPGALMRIVKRVAGGGLVATRYDAKRGQKPNLDETPTLLRAYRDGEICGEMTMNMFGPRAWARGDGP